MSTEVVMPRMGETVDEGTVNVWHKAVGDQVTEGEPLLEIGTDKVDTDIPAPASGTLAEIRVAEDETVLDEIDAEAKAAVDQATEEAKAGIEPRLELAFTDVWSDGGWEWRN